MARGPLVGTSYRADQALECDTTGVSTFEECIDYFTEAARIDGFDAKGTETSTGLYWYFSEHLAQDLERNPETNLLRALFRDRQQPPNYHYLVPSRDAELERLRHQGYRLNESQLIAVANAFAFPISFVQGPPGTGKTLTIAHMAREAIGKGMTVGIVSANTMAIENVYDALEDVQDRAALLTNSRQRPGTSYKHWKFQNKKGGWEESITQAEFQADYPIVLSTLHSVKKIFAGGVNFDLLIMDESSQTNLMLGIIALSCAKKVVLVGDRNQLPPIVKKSLRAELGPAPSPVFDLTDEDNSFLVACHTIFGTGPHHVLLNEHYRCHPGIIEFCNLSFYDGALHTRTDTTEYVSSKATLPIRITCYNGDFRESEENSSVNRKQLTILQHELIPEVRKHLEAGRTICFLTPFRRQAEKLASIIQAETDSRVEIDDPDGLVGNLANLKVGPKSSTIHRSQGQEFDVVYLLPVEDGKWRWPWSQGRNIVNVAVSRAKQELHLLVSSKLMSTTTQRELFGMTFAPEDEESQQQHAYIQRLVDYVHYRHPESDRGYGIKETELQSIFDSRHKYFGHRGTGSTSERLVFELLEDLAGEDLVVLRNVPLDKILAEGEPLASWGHLDFVVVDPETDKIVLAVEVDGAYHRHNPDVEALQDQQERDRKKDALLQAHGIDVLHGNKRREHSSTVMIRLPDDGTTFWETNQLRKRAKANFCQQYALNPRLGCGCSGLRNCLIDQYETIEDLLDAALADDTPPVLTLDPDYLELAELSTAEQTFLQNLLQACPTILRPGLGLLLNAFTPPEEESLSLTKFLGKWREDDEQGWLTATGGQKAKAINDLLVDHGILLIDGSWKLPTQKGRDLGLVTLEGTNRDGTTFKYAGYRVSQEQAIRREIQRAILGSTV